MMIKRGRIMTKKVFENDPYIKECTAKVISTKIINGSTWVTLDQTIFYPEGGGQPSDLGFIDGKPVLDVQIIDSEIVHKIDGSIDKNRVKLAIDFERRFDHMQQHTGQHLLSAVWQQLYGIETISFHLGKDVCTIDLATSELDTEKIRCVELKLAQYIFENRGIESYLLPHEEVDQEYLSKLKETPQVVRIVEIEGVNTSACCGTHVTMLGELGLLKIIGWEKYKQNVRLSFISGGRAFAYFQEIFIAINEVSKKLNVAPSLVTERFPMFYERHQDLKKNYQNLYEREIHYEAADLIKQKRNNLIEHSWEDRPLQEMKDLAKIIIEAGDKVVIFQNKSQKTWIFAASSSQLFNVSKCIQTLKENFGGKGGGNSVFGQWIGTIDESHWLEYKNNLLNT
jgi:alanyl-tRNA synthetase